MKIGGKLRKWIGNASWGKLQEGTGKWEEGQAFNQN